MTNMTQNARTTGGSPLSAREDNPRYAHRRTMGDDWNMSAKRPATGPRADRTAPPAERGGWFRALFG
jgi:hypothetical protein